MKLGTSRFYYPLFWKKYSLTSLIFLCYSPIKNSNFIKHKTTRHKTLGIVITYVILLVWKNTILRTNYYYFWWRYEFNVKNGEHVLFLPFWFVKARNKLFVSLLNGGTVCIVHIPNEFSQECRWILEHSWEGILKSEMVTLKRSSYHIYHVWNIYN